MPTPAAIPLPVKWANVLDQTRCIGCHACSTACYDEWSRKPVAPDLKALWVSLGVKSSKSDQIAFDEGAPLVQIRRDMTARAAPPAIAITKP